MNYKHIGNIKEDKNYSELVLQVQKIYLLHQILSMQGPQQTYFSPNPNTPYKIVSVVDANKCFTLQDQTHKLIITDYTGAPSQLFKIFQNNLKYAFVNSALDTALHVENNNKADGGVIRSDAGQHESSFFHIVPATQGQWAGKACCITTFAEGKSVDIKGGKANPNTEICQWKFHGGLNQQWLVIPADAPQDKKSMKEAVKEAKQEARQEAKQARQEARQEAKEAKQEAKEAKKAEKHQVPDVNPHFHADPKTLYKISSILDENIVLTVNKDLHLIVNKNNNNKNQHFHLFQENNKFGIVDQKNNTGLCIFQDKQDNAAQIITDNGKHVSSWFEIVRVEKGPFAHKGYIIKTHVPKLCLDIAGGKAEEGKSVLQYNIHEGGNQIWVIEPINAGKKVGQGKTNWTHKLEEIVHVIPQGHIGNDQGMGFAQNAQFKPNQNYIFYASHGNGIKSLDIAQDPQNFGGLIMYSFHGAPNQRFVFEQEGNMYRIRNVKEGKYLNVINDNAGNGAKIRCDDKGKFQSQLWTVIPATDPKYAGKNAFHLRSIFGQAMETPANTLDNQTMIQQGPFHGSDGQTWVIKEI